MDSVTSLGGVRVIPKEPVDDITPSNESRVDRESHFNGLYETKQNLRIEGVAEGEIQCAGTLTVAEGARVKAKVTANTVSIAGELEGEVVCRGVFQIMPTGLVEATVSAGRLIVQEGGLYNGEFRMITAEENKPRERGAATFTPGKANGTPIDKDEKPDDAEASGHIGSDDWWERMTNPTTANDSDDKPL